MQLDSKLRSPQPCLAFRKIARCLPLFLLVSSPCVAKMLEATQIDSAVESARTKRAIPFIAVAVTTATNLCHVRHYGDAYDGTHETAPPRFHSASISKLLTATVILQLQTEGKLSVDDPVGKYEPAFTSSSIKLVELLIHTSGIRDLDPGKARQEHQNVGDYIAALAAQKPTSQPGERWEYSDAGYNLLGRVVERVTGRPFADAMRERLLQPLAMHNSDFDVRRIPSDQRLAAFNDQGEQLSHPWHIAFLPSSGLQTTAEDLAKFARAILATETRNEPSSLIGIDALREMTRVRVATQWDGVGQGLGWQIANSELGPQWRHAGGERGFESLMTLYPNEGFAIVLLGNKKDWPRFELERVLRTMVSGAKQDCVNEKY